MTRSATPATSTSLWPTPTVSMMTVSQPSSPITRTTPLTPSARPPRWPREAIDRTKTIGSVAWRIMRTRSPRTAPPVNGDDGSTAMTPTRRSGMPSPELADEGVGERALAGARRAGDSDEQPRERRAAPASTACEARRGLEQLGQPRRVVGQQRHQPRRGARWRPARRRRRRATRSEIGVDMGQRAVYRIHPAAGERGSQRREAMRASAEGGRPVAGRPSGPRQVAGPTTETSALLGDDRRDGSRRRRPAREPPERPGPERRPERARAAGRPS